MKEKSNLKNSDLFVQAKTHFPVLTLVGRSLARRGRLESVPIGWHCHLTRLTALAVEEVIGAGARVYLSECNPATSEQDAIELMSESGATIYRGEESCLRVMENNPHVVSDTGFELIGEYLTGPSRSLKGGSEITTSGIKRLREGGEPRLSIPVINLNDGMIKSQIENFHGVGDGVNDLLARVTDQSWTSRRVAVVGYGRVGAGVSCYLRRLDASVTVVETDPVRALMAHYDGYDLCNLQSAARTCDLVVTATGRKKLLDESFWSAVTGDIWIVNVGHWAEEIDETLLRSLSRSVTEVSGNVKRYELSYTGHQVFLVANGHPANVSMLTGSIEPTLLHLATEVLAMEYMLVNSDRLKAGENELPAELEEMVAVCALEALHIDM